MRFLRLLVNSALCGAFFCLLLALLVLDLNINRLLDWSDVPLLAACLLPTYGLLFALAVLLVASVHRFLTSRPPTPGFVSPSFLTLGFSLVTLVFLVIFRENTVHFASFFTPAVQTSVNMQLGALFAAAAAGLILHYLHRHRKARRFYFPAGLVLAGAAVGFAVFVRSTFPTPLQPYRLSSLEAKKVGRRVTLLTIEGLSLDLVTPLVNERKLPNFAWLMENGSWGRLAGFTPSDPYVLRNTLATGKIPGHHHRLSDVRYRIPGFPGRLEVVPRFILFRQLKRLGLLEILPADGPARGKDVWKIFAEMGAVVAHFDPPPAAAGPAGTKPGPRADKLFSTYYKNLQYESGPNLNRVKAALDRDGETEERAFQSRSAAAEAPPQLFALHLDGLNEPQSYFYKYAAPDVFGDIRPEEIQKFGSVIERYYQYYDQIISRSVAAMKEDELLVVCSPFGVEPLPFWKRLVEWMLGNADVSAYHEPGPDGVVFFLGKGVTRGRNADGTRLADIVPTLLYYVGLPVAKDMDGIVRTGIFSREFKGENPILTISSYEDVAVTVRR